MNNAVFVQHAKGVWGVQEAVDVLSSVWHGDTLSRRGHRNHWRHMPIALSKTVSHQEHKLARKEGCILQRSDWPCLFSTFPILLTLVEFLSNFSYKLKLTARQQSPQHLTAVKASSASSESKSTSGRMAFIVFLCHSLPAEINWAVCLRKATVFTLNNPGNEPHGPCQGIFSTLACSKEEKNLRIKTMYTENQYSLYLL